MELASGPPGVCDGSSPASQLACAPASKARRAPRSTRASGCGPAFAVLSRCACCALPHLGICLRRLGVNGRGEEHAHHGGLDRAPLPLVAVRGPRLVLPISLCCCGLRQGGRWVLRGQRRQRAAAGGTGGPGGQLGPGIGGSPEFCCKTMWELRGMQGGMLWLVAWVLQAWGSGPLADSGHSTD